MKNFDRQPPIGYVLKALDTALSVYTDQALRPHQLTRLHWQILNTIQHGSGVTLAEVVEGLGNFADRERLQAVVVELAERQWLKQADQAYTLTSVGEAGLCAAAETQTQVREQLTRGLTRDDYDAVIETLQKMLKNISPSASG